MDEIIKLARKAAEETIRSEQLAHFYCDVDADNPPSPKRSWLDGSQAEWVAFDKEYGAALARALHVIDDKFSPDDHEDDAADHEENVTDFAVAAIWLEKI